jgi:two-component system, NtrC family, response regulator GlrR
MTMSSAVAEPPVEGGATAASILYLRAAERDRMAVKERLSAMGLLVTSVTTLHDALGQLANGEFTICLIDLADEQSALANIRAIRAQEPDLPITGIIDPARPLATAEAVNAGIADLLAWPFDEREVAMVVANARDRVGVAFAVPSTSALGASVFAHSAAMRTTVDAIRAAGSKNGGVLVCGEAGSGRQMAARAVHRFAGGADRPFVAVDCSGKSADELELTLFGFVSDKRQTALGRRTVDRINRDSAVFRASGGSLFVANVGDAPDRVQMKLARLIRDGEATLNEKRAIVPLEVRLMASLGTDPETALADARLRRDLYERLSQARVDVPPLRRRREDIPLLAVHLLGELARANGRAPQRFTRSALALLAALPWPGNARELRAVLETLVLSVRRAVIELEDLFDHVRLDVLSPRLDATGTLRDAKARFERDWISAVLVKHHGRVGEAARALGIQRTNLYRKVRQLNVARTLLSPRRS